MPAPAPLRDNGSPCTRLDMHQLLAAGAVAVLIGASLSVQAESISGNASETKTYRFNRGLPAGASATSLWQGVVVEVEGQTVKPRFVTHRRVFFSSWRDFPAIAVKACLIGTDGFSANNDCFSAVGNSLTVPNGKSPIDYSYQFQYEAEVEAVREDSFLLRGQPSTIKMN